MTAIRFFAVHVVLLLALAATAYVAGRLALRRAPALDARERAVVAGALGLVVLASLGCLLGLLGRLTLGPLLVAVVAIHLAGRRIWVELAARGAASRRWPGRRAALLAGVALALGAPLFALALYPPTAFDDTLYHLPFARAFAATGGLPFLPELRFPVFPQFAEVLSAELLLVGGDVATHLVQLLAIALTAALLVVWGREWGGAGQDHTAGWLAAAVWMGNPIVVYLGGTGYVEPLLALFVTASCWAFGKWRGTAKPGWLALAAVFAAAAAGTKYLGLFFVAALAATTLATRRRHLLLFLGVALLVMAPWYGRIVVLTGNPVFPYLSGIFGENDWTPVRFRTLAVPPGDAVALVAAAVRHSGRLLTLPWDVVARRHLVGGLPPFSPAYLVAAPFVAAVMARDRRLRRLLASAVCFVLLFPALPPDSRYLVTVLPLFSLALGIVAAAALRRFAPARPLAPAILAALLVVPGWLYAGVRIVRQGPVPATSAAREAYLLRSVPLYPAVARLHQEMRPGDTVYGLHAEQMRDFVRGNFLGDWYGPHRYGLMPDLATAPQALAATLRGIGVDFLLVAKPPGTAPLARVAGQSSFELLYEDPRAALFALRAPPGEG